MIRLIRLAVFNAAISGVSAAFYMIPAQAQTQMQEEQITWPQLVKKLEDEGYAIREIERKRDGWKAKVANRKGERYELRLSKSGIVVREEYDD